MTAKAYPTFPAAQARIPYIPFTEAIRLCRQCGGEFYPSDVPARLSAYSDGAGLPYGLCADCIDEAACAEMTRDWEGVA